MYGYYKLVIWVADITLYFQDSCLAAVRVFPSWRVEGIAVIFMLAEQTDAAVLEKESKKSTYVWDSKDIKVSFQIKNLLIFFEVGLFEAPASEFVMHPGQIWFGYAGYNHRYTCSLVGLVCKSSTLVGFTLSWTLENAVVMKCLALNSL